ncbi:hypothetical protein CRYUN_Cryun30bG0001100 [Craigia yunnanensis]
MEKQSQTVGSSAMEAFEKLEKVGEGTYGKVYRARERATGKIVALKKTRLHEDDEGVPPTTLREVSILRMLSRDPHVVRLMDVKQGQNKEGKTVLYLVFEYMDTDLKKFIRSFRQSGDLIPVNTVKSLMYQLCKGVAFCHGHGVLHRDLKPHNLLMDRKTMTLKIADLGLARAFTLPIKKYTHELSWLPNKPCSPEILNCSSSFIFSGCWVLQTNKCGQGSAHYQTGMSTPSGALRVFHQLFLIWIVMGYISYRKCCNMIPQSVFQPKKLWNILTLPI